MTAFIALMAKWVAKWFTLLAELHDFALFILLQVVQPGVQS
jgi:hypothetical protein